MEANLDPSRKSTILQEDFNEAILEISEELFAALHNELFKMLQQAGFSPSINQLTSLTDKQKSNDDRLLELDKVLKNLIPINLSQIMQAHKEICKAKLNTIGQDTIILLGKSGVGKSTFAHFVAGSTLSMQQKIQTMPLVVNPNNKKTTKATDLVKAIVATKPIENPKTTFTPFIETRYQDAFANQLHLAKVKELYEVYRFFENQLMVFYGAKIRFFF